MSREHLSKIEFNKISMVMAPMNTATASYGVWRAILEMGTCRTNEGGLSSTSNVGLTTVPCRVVSKATSPACPPLRVPREAETSPRPSARPRHRFGIPPFSSGPHPQEHPQSFCSHGPRSLYISAAIRSSRGFARNGGSYSDPALQSLGRGDTHPHAARAASSAAIPRPSAVTSPATVGTTASTGEAFSASGPAPAHRFLG